MAITSNGYGEGMNKDITKSKFKPSQYIDAQNIRIATKDGLSTLSANNVKGNQEVLTNLSQFNHTLPITQPSYYLLPYGEYGTGSAYISITTSAGTQTEYYPGTGPTPSVKALYDFIISNFTGYGTEFNVVLGNDRVVIYSVSIDVNPTSPENPQFFTIGLNSYGGNLEKIIGYGTIRDSIILFTTASNSASGGQGSIWKLTYDDTVQPFDYTLKLIYSNANIGFTTQHPIINEAKGNYENINVQKIYWTDNFNNIRYINVEDPNVFALDPNDLSTSPSVSLSVPKLYSINDQDGSLNEHYTYQCFYRLKMNGGGSSNFSSGSTYVSILSQPEINMNTAAGHVPTREYWGSGAATIVNKSITFQIEDIDQSYDIIEVAVVNTLTYKTILFHTDFISSGSILCTFRSEDQGTTIDVSEITTYNSLVDRAKTIEIKDQRLLLGNVSESSFVVDFDTRAYRFPSRTLDTGSGFTYNGETIYYNTTFAQQWDGTIVKDITNNYTKVPVNFSGLPWLPDDADAINPNQRPYELGTALNPNFKFQIDGKTVGGTGPNISYNFVTELINGDNYTNANFPDPANPGKDWRKVDSTGLSTSSFSYNGRTYHLPTGSTYNFIDNYHSELFKGYQREEIYRFGIVFIDRTGRKSAVSWIADILMPGWYEQTPLGEDDYAISEQTSISTQNFRCLGVEFGVNNQNRLPATITHYEIVRVKRTEADKSVLFGGPLFYSEDSGADCIYTGGIGSGKPQWQLLRNSYTYTTPPPFYTIVGLDNWLKAKITNTGYTFKVGDYITIPGSLELVNNDSKTEPFPPPFFDFTYELSKMYKCVNQGLAYGNLNLTDTYTIGDYDTLDPACGYLPPGSSDLYMPAIFYYDFTGSYINEGVIGEVNYSNVLYIPGGSTSLPSTVFNDKYIFAYYHRVLTDQYGGNSYLQRSTNQYISTYNFNKRNNGYSTFKVFGGDMYFYIHDYLHYKWQQSAGQPVEPTDPGYNYGFGFYYPVETYYNVEWQENLDIPNRSGIRTNFTFNGFQPVNHNYPSYRTNQADPIISYYPVPGTITSLSTVHDNRIYASEIKYNGEAGESWGIFKANNFRDVDGIYGPINKLIAWKDNVYFFQDKAYGIIPVNLRSLVEDTSGAALQLGTGDVLSKQGYVSFDTGTKHQFSVVAADSGIYFYDILGKNLMVHKGQPLELSEIQGLDAYFPEHLTGRISMSDNTLYGPAAYGSIPAGIVGTYDYRYNQVIYTFKDAQKIDGVWTAKNFTVAYNDLLGSFESFYSFDPYIYISDRNNVFSVQDTDLYLHNYGNYGEFYGVTYPSSIKFITNPSPNLTKVFDNIAIQSEVYDTNGVNIGETIDKIRCTTDYQDSGTINLVSPTTIRRRERTWTLDVPRDTATAAYTSVSKPRLRDKYLVTELTFTNNNNKKLVLHDTVTAFRESKAGYPDL